jgi:hypothetical protein
MRRAAWHSSVLGRWSMSRIAVASGHVVTIELCFGHGTQATSDEYAKPHLREYTCDQPHLDHHPTSCGQENHLPTTESADVERPCDLFV